MLGELGYTAHTRTGRVSRTTCSYAVERVAHAGDETVIAAQCRRALSRVERSETRVCTYVRRGWARTRKPGSIWMSYAVKRLSPRDVHTPVRECADVLLGEWSSVVIVAGGRKGLRTTLVRVVAQDTRTCGTCVAYIWACVEVVLDSHHAWASRFFGPSCSRSSPTSPSSRHHSDHQRIRRARVVDAARSRRSVQVYVQTSAYGTRYGSITCSQLCPSDGYRGVS